jgi:uncharacterized integral membrane protein
MRKLVTALIFVPLLIVFVTFAVANREIVTVTFDPFDSVNPAYAVKLPLFLLIVALIAMGVLIGGLTTWINQRKWRTRARRAEADAREVRAQLAAHKWSPDRLTALPPAPPPERFAYPPAA